MEKNELDGPFFLMIIAVTDSVPVVFSPSEWYVIFETVVNVSLKNEY